MANKIWLKTFKTENECKLLFSKKNCIRAAYISRRHVAQSFDYNVGLYDKLNHIHEHILTLTGSAIRHTCTCIQNTHKSVLQRFTRVSSVIFLFRFKMTSVRVKIYTFYSDRYTHCNLDSKVPSKLEVQQIILTDRGIYTPPPPPWGGGGHFHWRLYRMREIPRIANNGKMGGKGI